MDATIYDPDPELNEIITEAIARLGEHVEHVLGSDPGCGMCMWCATCEVRVMAKDLFCDVIDQGWFRHARFGNAPGVWPPPRSPLGLDRPRRPVPPPLGLLGRTPRARR